MNTYPSLAQWDGTKLVPRSGVVERVASNGSVRLRAMTSGRKMDPTVVHGFMSATDYATFLTFYDANRAIPFNFTATEDGLLRTVAFAAANPFQIEPLSGVANMYKVTVNMREV